MPKSKQFYDPAAMNEVAALKPRIEQVAAHLGLRPEAIFGALVEENHDFRVLPYVHALGDNFVRWRNDNHEQLRQFFEQAERFGTLDDHNGLDKLSNVTFNDVGPFNIQIGTAIRLLRDYLQTTPPDQDPLSLRRYTNDYPLLVQHLMTASDTAPAIAGLMLVEGKHYMERLADKRDWSGKSWAEQDGVLVTYYNMGRATISQRREVNMLENKGAYMPQPGPNKAGGVNHVYNADAIGRIFGHSDYNVRKDAPSAGSHPALQPAAVSPILPVAPPEQSPPAVRPPSSQFVDYQNAHAVRLKPGGALSDVVAIERSRGNPITLEDLRAVNGLLEEMDKKLALDQPLLVPQRRQDRLQIDNGQVKLDLNLGDGSYQCTIQDAATQSVIRLGRSRDAASGAYNDHYAVADATSGQVRRETRNAVGAGYPAHFQAGLQSPANSALPPALPAWADFVFNRNAAAAPAGSPAQPDRFISDTRYHTLPSIAALYGVPLDALEADNPGLSRAMSLRPGTAIKLPVTVPVFELQTRPDPQTQWHRPPEGRLQQDVRDGFVSNDPTKSILFRNGALDASDFARVQMASMATGGVRPGALQASDTIRPGSFLQNHRVDFSNDAWLKDSLSLNTLATQVTHQTYVDPLLLDLDGNGIGMTDYINDGVLFDLDRSGTLKRSGWADRRTGILVRDDDSGQIRDGSQLFSEYYGITDFERGVPRYRNGYGALATEDANLDGTINSQDPVWSSLRIWIDANHDAKSDAGELHTPASLGISAFSLRHDVEDQIRDGNHVRASGHFVRNGQQQTMWSVEFIGSPVGHQLDITDDRLKLRTHYQDHTVSAYRSRNASGENLDAAALGVDNLYGAGGDDTLTAAPGGSWLVGGPGSNRYRGGDGNDVLVISASDRQENIAGGGGLNTAIIVGTQGVTLNMAQAQVQIAQGGEGDDLIVSGGHGGVFMQGGKGHSTLIGGAGHDVLVGGQGDNTIYGGSARALIYAGPRRNTIYAAQDGSIIYAGGGESRIFGAAGDDIVVAGAGSSEIDGGGGCNIAEFNGSYADYRIERTPDGFIVRDTQPGRDGTARLRHIQKLNFADIKAIDLSMAHPMPVPDSLTQDASGAPLQREGVIRLSSAQLLSNDQPLSSQGPLRVSEVGDAVGGEVRLEANGDILFTPSPRFGGVMRFKYSITDSAGHGAAWVEDLINDEHRTMRASVALLTPELPSDPLLGRASYLSVANIPAVWRDYSGKGVRIGQFEAEDVFAVGPEVMDVDHPDLRPSLDPAWLASRPKGRRASNHATTVAGVMVAARDGQGSVGVAYDARLSGYSLGHSAPEQTELGKMAAVDIANLSWSVAQPLLVSLIDSGLYTYYQYAAAYGRRGLGTVQVTAGGNERANGGNAQDSMCNNHRFAIQVGAIGAQTDLSTLQPTQKPFSNPGASLLVSAPGSNMISTSQRVATERGTPFGASHRAVNGTSFATPVVSGIVALMLEANPELGYRDVQQILALSARKISDPNTIWQDNHARHWNGGGMHVSHDYGFGLVDARAAVRLAETWIGQHTFDNLQLSGAYNEAVLSVAGGGRAETILRLEPGIKTEHVEVVVDLDFQRLGDVILTLTSPDGTESRLLSRSGKAPGSSAEDRGNARPGPLGYTLMTTRDWGENSGGDWRLTLESAEGGGPVTLHRWAVGAFGAPKTADDHYVYTDEFATLGQGARATLDDAVNGSVGGRNTLNAAALSDDSHIDLQTGEARLAGRALRLVRPESIHHVIGGDGNDIFKAHDSGSLLAGGRGENTLHGAAGADLFVVQKRDRGQDIIVGFNPQQGDRLQLLGLRDGRFDDLRMTQQGDDVQLALSDSQRIVLKNLNTTALNADQVIFSARWQPPAQWLTGQMPPPENNTQPAGVVYLDGETTGFTLNGLGMTFTGTTYRGSNEPDRFVVRKHGGGNFSNVVLGFKDGIDKIDVSGLGIRHFSDMGLSRVTLNNVRSCSLYNKAGRDVFERNVVYLSGIDESQVDAGDFIFASEEGASASVRARRAANTDVHASAASRHTIDRLVQTMAGFAPETSVHTGSEPLLTAPIAGDWSLTAGFTRPEDLRPSSQTRLM